MVKSTQGNFISQIDGTPFKILSIPGLITNYVFLLVCDQWSVSVVKSALGNFIIQNYNTPSSDLNFIYSRAHYKLKIMKIQINGTPS